MDGSLGSKLNHDWVMMGKFMRIQYINRSTLFQSNVASWKIPAPEVYSIYIYIAGNMDSKALFSHQESSEMHMILLVWVMDQQLCAASGASVWRRYHFSKSTCSLDVTGVSKYLCVQFFVKTSRCLLLRTERIDQIQQNVTNFPGLVISTSIARKYSLNTCFREIHLSFLSSLSFSSYGNSSQYSRYIFLVIH